jgi:hypothetical protein
MVEIEELTNKIVEVKAIAQVVVQNFGHLKKFAKHVVAFAIKQIKGFTDVELAKFVGKEDIGKLIGYEKEPNPTVFSKFRERAEPEIFEFVANVTLWLKYKDRPIKRIAQDSTGIDAYSEDDPDADWGKRTIPKKRQVTDESVESFFGYKLHAGVDADTDNPIAFFIRPANRHDKKLFGTILTHIKENFRIAHKAKYIADSALDSFDVRRELRYNDIKDLIAINGRGHRESGVPKDPDYGKRWSIERFFSRLKEVFGLGRNRFIGIRKVMIHVYSCIIDYLISYL